MELERPNDLVSDRVRMLLRLPDVGQVGYVVQDVYRAIQEWQVAHQRVTWLVLDHDHPRTMAGKQGRCTLRIALAYQGPLQIELIQVLKGETIHVDAAGAPEGRIHHLGFMVRDLEHRLQYCRGQGAELLQEGKIRSAGITADYAYLDATALGNTNLILELIQWRLGPMPMPTSRHAFSTLRSFGSWNVFRGKIVR